MTRIESRPSRRKKWDYVFFLDIDGHADEPHVAKALAALKKRASLFRVLGSYPRAVSVNPRFWHQTTRCGKSGPAILAVDNVRTLSPYVPGKPIEELRARARHHRHHQAGVERESLRAEPAGARRHAARARPTPGCIPMAAATCSSTKLAAKLGVDVDADHAGQRLQRRCWCCSPKPS